MTTRSGRVVRPVERLVDAPVADDDVTDEDESVEMDSSVTSNDDGSSLADFIIDDDSLSETEYSRETDEEDRDVYVDFVESLFDGAPAAEVLELRDAIENEDTEKLAKFRGLLRDMLTLQGNSEGTQ